MNELSTIIQEIQTMTGEEVSIIHMPWRTIVVTSTETLGSGPDLPSAVSQAYASTMEARHDAH